ncbi:MAG TPA: DUF192 domain-containing protein [Chloroflexia bacterium]|nr:DUF192 domain-containing protein [Chloroflexia bacterium]
MPSLRVSAARYRQLLVQCLLGAGCLLLVACVPPGLPAPGTPGIDLATPLPAFAPPTNPPRATATAVLLPMTPSVAVPPGPTADISLPQVVLTGQAGPPVRLYVEIADTPDKQETGLMHRTSMAEDQGMLFVFAGETTTPFWMKDTLLPLSIAFIKADGRIVDIQDMQAQDLSLHTPAEPYSYALEMNLGYFARHGIVTGDRAQLPALSAPTPALSPTAGVPDASP